MFSITNINFWLSLIGILASFFTAFYIPGRVVISDFKIKQKNATHILAIIIGLVLWAWQSYIFEFIHLSWLSYLYLILFFAFYLYKKYYRELKISFKSLKFKELVLLAIVIPGVLAQTMSYFQMGLKTNMGIILTSHNLADHLWHAGLISELIDRFPPDEPGMAGVSLKDYHYWFNLVTADLILIFQHCFSLFY